MAKRGEIEGGEGGWGLNVCLSLISIYKVG